MSLFSGRRTVLVEPDSGTSQYVSWSGSEETSQIVVLNLETGEQEVLISGGTSPRYATSGHLLYAAAGSVWAVPFDIDDLAVGEILSRFWKV